MLLFRCTFKQLWSFIRENLLGLSEILFLIFNRIIDIVMLSLLTFVKPSRWNIHIISMILLKVDIDERTFRILFHKRSRNFISSWSFLMLSFWTFRHFSFVLAELVSLNIERKFKNLCDVWWLSMLFVLSGLLQLLEYFDKLTSWDPWFRVKRRLVSFWFQLIILET